VPLCEEKFSSLQILNKSNLPVLRFSRNYGNWSAKFSPDFGVIGEAFLFSLCGLSVGA
jgi:hypothetical protein